MFFYHVILPYAYLQFTLSITCTYFWYYVNIGYIKTRPNVKFSLYLKKAGLAPGGGGLPYGVDGDARRKF